MGGLILRLAGPLQSWGHHSAFHHRDTAPHPTRSALIGMFAAAQGRPRPHALDPYHDLPGTPTHHDLTFTVRIDRPGKPHTDYHTVGGAARRGAARLHTADGKHRAPKLSTLQSWRHYLTDAVFTVAVQGPDALIAHIADTLETPVWHPYLGRRTCVPDEPLVLTGPIADPVTELLTHTPLTCARPPQASQDTIAVPVIWEHPPPRRPEALPDRELPSMPIDFSSHHRLHQPRPLWRTTEEMPAHLYAGRQPLDALTRYVLQDRPCPNTP